MTDMRIDFCSVCYCEKSFILSSCGDFICANCFQSVNRADPKCPKCLKPIDFKKVLDLRVKENLKKIDFIFDEPELHLRKIIESIKFQKMHQKKYIDFLQGKIDGLMKENTSLKATMKASSSFYQNNQSFVSQNISYCNTRDMSVDMSPIPSNVINMSHIKKIEPKRGTNKHSNKLGIHYTPITINNLNAQTASGQLSNQAGKGLINLNINNPIKDVPNSYLRKNNYHVSPGDANAYKGNKY